MSQIQNILNVISKTGANGVSGQEQILLTMMVSKMTLSAPAQPGAQPSSSSAAGGRRMCCYIAEGSACSNLSIPGTMFADRCATHTSSGYSESVAALDALETDQGELADDKADDASGFAAFMALRDATRVTRSAAAAGTSAGPSPSSDSRMRAPIGPVASDTPQGICGTILKHGLRAGLGCPKDGLPEFDGRCKTHRS